jgi:hypothetical protein
MEDDGEFPKRLLAPTRGGVIRSRRNQGRHGSVAVGQKDPLKLRKESLNLRLTWSCQ